MPARTPRKQPIAALALAAGATHAEAGEKAGVSERTIARWLEDPAFALEVEAAQAQALDQALGELGVGAREAVRVLRALLRPGATADSVRLGAAKQLVVSALRWHDRQLMERDILARLDELERKQREENVSWEA